MNEFIFFRITISTVSTLLQFTEFRFACKYLSCSCKNKVCIIWTQKIKYYLIILCNFHPQTKSNLCINEFVSARDDSLSLVEAHFFIVCYLIYDDFLAISLNKNKLNTDLRPFSSCFFFLNASECCKKLFTNLFEMLA